MILLSERQEKNLAAIILTPTHTQSLIFLGQHETMHLSPDFSSLQATTLPMVVGHDPAHSSLVCVTCLLTFLHNRSKPLLVIPYNIK